MATYELWEMSSGNLVGSWPAEAEALTVVRDALARHGAELVASLALLSEDAQGDTTVVAEGAALVERARQMTSTPGQRSA
jgi:hypothetical protein